MADWYIRLLVSDREMEFYYFQKQIFLFSCGLQGIYGIFTDCALQNLLSYFQQSVKKSHE